MNQTIGSQLFGPWYDIAFFVLLAGLFFGAAFRFSTLPIHLRNRIPLFLQDKATCLILGMLSLGMAVYQYTNQAVPATSLPPATIAAFGDPEWEQISSNDGGETVSIDRKSVVSHWPVVEYSEQMSFTPPKEFPQPLGTVTSAKSRLFVNCTERSKVRMEFVVTRADGSQGFQDKSAPPVKSAISNDPSAPEYVSSSYVCAHWGQKG